MFVLVPVPFSFIQVLQQLDTVLRLCWIAKILTVFSLARPLVMSLGNCSCQPYAAGASIRQGHEDKVESAKSAGAALKRRASLSPVATTPDQICVVWKFKV